jgi:hypothetical protein
MLKDKSAIARGLTRKLMTYGLGRRMGFADRDAIQQIAASVQKQGYGFRDLIHVIVQSDLFQRP